MVFLDMAGILDGPLFDDDVDGWVVSFFL